MDPQNPQSQTQDPTVSSATTPPTETSPQPGIPPVQQEVATPTTPPVQDEPKSNSPIPKIAIVLLIVAVLAVVAYFVGSALLKESPSQTPVPVNTLQPVSVPVTFPTETPAATESASPLSSPSVEPSMSPQVSSTPEAAI